MDLKRRTLALAVAVLVAALVGPPTTAAAAGGEVSPAGMIQHQGQGIGDDDQPGDNADAGDPKENSDEPAHHGDGEEGDESGDESGDKGPCVVAAGPVAVCVDQPR